MDYDELLKSILTAQEQMLQHSIEANSVTLNGRKYGKLIENLPPNIKPTIFGMAVKADYALPDDYDFLVQYEPPKPKSNADRIRAMTDEELADWLGVYCNGQTAQEIGKPCVSGMGSCEECWLDWLREEAKDGEQS